MTTRHVPSPARRSASRASLASWASRRGLSVALALALLASRAGAEDAAAPPAPSRLPAAGVKPRAGAAAGSPVELRIDARSLPPSVFSSEASISVTAQGQAASWQLSTNQSMTVAFRADASQFGPIDVAIHVGRERYVIPSAFVVVAPPVFQGSSPTGDGDPLRVGERGTVGVVVRGASADQLSLWLGGRRLYSRPGAREGEIEALLLERSDVDDAARLAVRVLDETIATRAIDWAPAPRVDAIEIQWAGGGVVRATIVGESLSDDVEVVLRRGKEAPLAFSPGPARGGLREYTLSAPFDPRNGSFRAEARWDENLLFWAEGHWREDGAGWRWRQDATSAPCARVGRREPPSPTVVEPPSPESKLSSQLARPGWVSVSLRGTPVSFVSVPAMDGYRFGMTEAQRGDARLLRGNLVDSPPLGKGPVALTLLRTFYLGEREVTRAQYWRYLRDMRSRRVAVTGPKELLVSIDAGAAEPPPGTEDLPVVNVSYRDAERFASWLDEDLRARAPDWRVRLPHEIEWEIAARRDGRRHAFPDADADRVLREIASRPPLARVGSLADDRSWVGALDLTGSVREWTATVYDIELVRKLDAQTRAGLFTGWDPSAPHSDPRLVQELPRDPAVSRLMCVRGGANGETSPMVESAVRRLGECTSAYPDVGFRLVLVPAGTAR